MLVTICFVILALSGVMLFVSPPGRVANWTNWTLLGLRKHEWGGLHISFGTVFLTFAVIHLILNWRPLASYFKSKLTRRMGLRWEWVVALVFCGALYAGIRAGVPPFSSLLAFNEEIKESWEKPTNRAPIPHAELLSLGELAQRAEVDLPTAFSRLTAAGITNPSAESIVGTLAERSQVSGQRIYQIIRGNSTARGAGGKGGAGLGGGAGGGTGRTTLVQYCAEHNLVVTDALARLEAKGIHARETLTLREIAVNNGYDKPFEVMDIINAR